MEKRIKSLLFVLTCLMLIKPGQQEEQCRDEAAATSSAPAAKDEESVPVFRAPENPKGLAQEAVEKARRGEGTRVFSNFLQDDSLLCSLTNPRIWFSCYESTRGKTTRWLERGDAPKNIFEFVALEIWKDQPVLKDVDFAGYEIWCNLLTPDGPLPWHLDKDEAPLIESDGKNISLPFYGSVFYGYPHSYKGGYLEVSNEDQDTWQPSLDENSNPPEFERISAEYNRLVIFNASKYHRVSPITEGIRVTLAVNVWKERPLIAFVDDN